MTIKRVYRITKEAPDIPFAQFRRLFKAAMAELFQHHKPPKAVVEYFRKNEPSFCKRMYNHIGPFMQEIINLQANTAEDAQNTVVARNTAGRQRSKCI